MEAVARGPAASARLASAARVSTRVACAAWGDLTTTYVATVIVLVAIYPACLWYRSVKAAYPRSVLKYI